jgi:hypothetical protein
MNHQDRYEDAVRRLANCGYEVLPDGQGYIVQHLTDRADVSDMHDLDQLVELADLFEWRQQRRKS